MTVRRAGWTTLIACAGFAFVACSAPSAGGSSAAPARAQSDPAASAPSPVAEAAGAQALTIITGDYYFKPNEVTLRPGTVTVNLINDGPRLHKFYVRNLDDTGDLFKGDDRIPAGESKTVTFTLPDVGRYKIYCAIPGHADRGEVGFLVVGS